MASLATLQTWLAQAEAARHKLVMGERVVSFNITTGAATRSFTYAQTDMDKLDDYISGLHTQIAAASNAKRKRIVRLYQSGRGY
jgi:hypothetical protein